MMQGWNIIAGENIVTIIIGIGAIVGGLAYVYTRWRGSKNMADKDIANDAMANLSKTVEALKTQNGLQEGQITSLNNDRKDLTKEVGVLTGKVETLSTIPLEKIEQHMADTNRILNAILPLIPVPDGKTLGK